MTDDTEGTTSAPEPDTRIPTTKARFDPDGTVIVALSVLLDVASHVPALQWAIVPAAPNTTGPEAATMMGVRLTII